MNMIIKEMLKLFAPPILTQAYRALRARIRGGLYLSGNYSSWAEALAASTGYDSEIILEKTRVALLKVKKGEAAYERDSVLFDEIQYSWPLLAGLMWVAAQSGGRLNVLDFGGSLGTTYFQNRHFLERLPVVRWNIVEQPRWVEVGKAEFEDERLKFYGSIEACLAETQPNVIILSGVLQYLERPFDVLCTLSASQCNYLIIDRTPFWDGPMDRLCVQHVPASIYPASYPCWIFSAHRFRSFLSKSWEIVAEFEGFDRLPSPVKTTWKGIIACRRDLPFGVSEC